MQMSRILFMMQEHMLEFKSTIDSLYEEECHYTSDTEYNKCKEVYEYFRNDINTGMTAIYHLQNLFASTQSSVSMEQDKQLDNTSLIQMKQKLTNLHFVLVDMHVYVKRFKQTKNTEQVQMYNKWTSSLQQLEIWYKEVFKSLYGENDHGATMDPTYVVQRAMQKMSNEVMDVMGQQKRDKHQLHVLQEQNENLKDQLENSNQKLKELQCENGSLRNGIQRLKQRTKQKFSIEDMDKTLPH